MQEWEAFESVEGPLLLHDRVEFATAFVAAAVASAAGAKDVKLQDFMPNWRGVAPAEQQDPEQIMNFLKGLAESKKKGKKRDG